MNAARALQPAPIVTPPRLPAPANSVRQIQQTGRDSPVGVGGLASFRRPGQLAISKVGTLVYRHSPWAMRNRRGTNADAN